VHLSPVSPQPYTPSIPISSFNPMPYTQIYIYLTLNLCILSYTTHHPLHNTNLLHPHLYHAGSSPPQQQSEAEVSALSPAFDPDADVIRHASGLRLTCFRPPAQINFTSWLFAYTYTLKSKKPKLQGLLTVPAKHSEYFLQNEIAKLLRRGLRKHVLVGESSMIKEVGHDASNFPTLNNHLKQHSTANSHKTKEPAFKSYVAPKKPLTTFIRKTSTPPI
ncbi:hypothetical protein M8C21_017562, partial [Ambrosia artemisiifolia]